MTSTLSTNTETKPSIKLTSAQCDAIDSIIDDIKLPYARPVLCGYAGTGKTVTTAALVTRLIYKNKRVVVATPTHKARAQVERALKAYGAKDFEAVTIHRLLGLKRVRDFTTGKETFEPDPNPNATNMLNQTKAWFPEIGKITYTRQVDVVIIDETSMLGTELYKYLLNELGPRPAVFVGDDRQLLPIKESQVCAAFTEATSTYRLTEVMRHDGAILNLATATRQLDVGRAVFTSAVGGDTEVIAYNSREQWLAALLKYTDSEDSKSDPDFCRVLAWTNAAVEDMNMRIHKNRYGNYADEFVEGMICVTADAIPQPNKTIPLLNSTVDVLVVSVEPAERMFDLDLLDTDGDPWPVWHLEVQVVGAETGYITFDVLQKEAQPRWRERLKELATTAKQEKENDKRKTAWKNYFNFRDSVGKLQPASALTIHKSQGSTFSNVFLHWSIDSPRAKQLKLQNQLAYVGITRASHTLHVLKD